MKIPAIKTPFLGIVALLLASCSTAEVKKSEIIQHFPVDGIEGVRNLLGVMYDPADSFDGNGSLRLQARRFTSFLIYEIQDIDVEEARLIYSARVKTKDVNGQVYLEMEGDFFTRGEISTKGIQHSLTASTDWTERHVEFMLRKSENPVSIRLYLIINGSGTAWIDDVKLMRAPF